MLNNILNSAVHGFFKLIQKQHFFVSIKKVFIYLIQHFIEFLKVIDKIEKNRKLSYLNFFFI